VTGAALLAIALSGPLGGPAPPAAFHVSGRGWGHGVGLAQYGAMGYAREEQRGHRWILEHYFPGTGLREAAGGRIRVRLRERPAARVSGSTRARAADGRRIRLRARSTYRFAAAEGDRVAVTDAATGSLRARLHGPVRLTGARPLRLLGVAENGRKDGHYRGTLVLHRTASGVLVIDDVGVERYLDAVVPAEMPAMARGRPPRTGRRGPLLRAHEPRPGWGLRRARGHPLAGLWRRRGRAPTDDRCRPRDPAHDRRVRRASGADPLPFVFRRPDRGVRGGLRRRRDRLLAVRGGSVRSSVAAPRLGAHAHA
jgi:hypothetical protein